MRHRYIHLIILGVLILFATDVSAQISKVLLGDWTFDAPDAPEGSTFGAASLRSDTVTMIFEGALRFPSDWVRATGDSIIYETSFEKDKVRFSLKVIDDQNLSGKAVWENGETLITFKRRKV